ncbi:MAG: quinone-dependent dihydroorotate dehydrogenase [Caulobacteraceae bacterium]|nr:quinone-dependent dihydroorotate dehydrogenase [Caulobacteraceae bacterium]
MTLHDLGARTLRLFDPETAHGVSLAAMSLGLGPRHSQRDPTLSVTIAGLTFPNCVGLAAGYDKNAEVPDAMLAAGFGFVECGSVTPRPQDGNPRPRLFRLTEDRAVINRMGFNNQGLDAFEERLKRRRGMPGVVGANIGANKDSADRTADYVEGLRRLWPWASYFTANISSPNTPGLRALQTRAALDDLLGRLREARAGLTAAHGPRPVFLKVAPDLDEGEIAQIAEACLAGGIDALVVSNTTVDRPGGLRSRQAAETGGLSGKPLFQPSTQVLADFYAATQGRLPLIGVGGVGSAQEAWAKIRAGASAVQLYSALVFEGPGLVGRIRDGLRARLAAEGFGHLSEAVGRS